jgi:hypothetical protein
MAEARQVITVLEAAYGTAKFCICLPVVSPASALAMAKVVGTYGVPALAIAAFCHVCGLMFGKDQQKEEQKMLTQ